MILISIKLLVETIRHEFTRETMHYLIFIDISAIITNLRTVIKTPSYLHKGCYFYTAFRTDSFVIMYAFMPDY